MNNNYKVLFDEIFNAHTTDEIELDMPILNMLFNELRDKLYTTSKEYIELQKECCKLYDELFKSLNIEQKELLEKIDEMNCQIYAEQEKKLFIWGYLIARELDRESNIKKFKYMY